MLLNLEKLRQDFKLCRKKDENLSYRLSVLIEYTKIELLFNLNPHKEAKSIKLNALCLSLDISLRTILRWKKAYKLNGKKTLKKRIATGREAKPITGHTAAIITQMRENYRWGAEVIGVHLLLDHQIDIKKNRIERYLTNSGLRHKYPCTTCKKKNARAAKEHKKVVKVDNPGHHTQVDTKHLPHIFPQSFLKCYVFNFIDHASNWSFKKAYLSYGYKQSEDFFKCLLEVCPFDIIRLQTDGGTEFTNKYISKYIDEPKEHPLAKFCITNGIRQVVIPPGEKELQGLVERSHRQDDQELYSRIVPLKLEEMNQSLYEYCQWRNSKRRFKKLGWQTPDEWLENYFVKSLAQLLHFGAFQFTDQLLLEAS